MDFNSVACVVIICITLLLAIPLTAVMVRFYDNNGFKVWKKARFDARFRDRKGGYMYFVQPSECTIMGSNVSLEYHLDPINCTIDVTMKGTFKEDEILRYM